MKRLFFCLFLGILGQTFQSQNIIGMDTSYHIVPNPAYYGNNVYHYRIKNYGATAFSGYVYLDIAVDSTGTGNGSFILAKQDSFNLNLPVNGTQTDTSIVNITQAVYRHGINTVVIWPRTFSTTIITHDSLKVQVLVLGYMDINSFSTAKPIIFPNPSSAFLFVKNTDAVFVIEQVRICDEEGRILSSCPFKSMVDLRLFPPGNYVVEFIGVSGGRVKYKIIKE